MFFKKECLIGLLSSSSKCLEMFHLQILRQLDSIVLNFCIWVINAMNSTKELKIWNEFAAETTGFPRHARSSNGVVRYGSNSSKLRVEEKVSG